MTEDTLSASLLHLTRLLEDLEVTTPLEDGAVSLEFGEGLRLDLTASESGQIDLISPLALEDASPSPAFIKRLLEANFLRRGSREAVFGLGSGVPVLMRSVNPSSLSYPDFRQVVEDFVNTADTWSAASVASSDATSPNDVFPDTTHYLSA